MILLHMAPTVLSKYSSIPLAKKYTCVHRIIYLLEKLIYQSTLELFYSINKILLGQRKKTKDKYIHMYYRNANG